MSEKDKNLEVEDIVFYEYTFTNPVRELFELFMDLPILLFVSFEKIEDSNENESTVKFAMLSDPELYKFKIIEKKPDRIIVYDYDFMETYVGERGRLTLIFDEISLEKVKLNVQNQIIDSRLKQYETETKAKLAGLPLKYHSLVDNRRNLYQYNWLGKSLNEKLKRKDIRKIFVKYKGKRILVQDGSLGGLGRGFTLELNALNITDIKNEVEGLENLRELTDLYLRSNNIKEITDLDKLVNLAILYLENNKIEWISGLENLSNLQRLYLSGNNIHEIEGLENLTNLRILHLNDNKISEIRGMENQEKLQHFEIKNNLIPEDIINELGGYQKSYSGKPLNHVRFPQRFVRYCRKSNIITEPEKRFKIKENVLITKLKEFAEVSQKIRLSMLRNALDLDKRTFDNKIFKWAKEFNFKIDGDFIIIEGDILEFINSLDNKFKDWERESKKI